MVVQNYFVTQCIYLQYRNSKTLSVIHTWTINCHYFTKNIILHNLLHFFLAVCVPSICGCGCRKKVFKRCLIRCLKWNNCCYKVTDPKCLAFNAGCTILRASLNTAIAIAEAALITAQASLVAVEGVVRGLQVVVDESRLVLDAAIAFLEVRKQILAVGLKASEAITKFLLTEIVNIREIGFDVQLARFSHGRISAYIDVSFLGQSPTRLSVTLPIFNPLALVADLAERAIPGIGRKKRSIGKRMNKVFM